MLWVAISVNDTDYMKLLSTESTLCPLISGAHTPVLIPDSPATSASLTKACLSPNPGFPADWLCGLWLVIQCLEALFLLLCAPTGHENSGFTHLYQPNFLSRRGYLLISNALPCLGQDLAVTLGKGSENLQMSSPPECACY